MSALGALREALRRFHVQRALRRGERIGGLGLLGHGVDAIIMRSPESLRPVVPVEQRVQVPVAKEDAR